MSINKFHMGDLLHSVYSVGSLIADTSDALVLTVFVGEALVAVDSTDAGTAGGDAAIALVAGFFLFAIFSCSSFAWHD